MKAYRETIDWMYSDDPAALKTYAEFVGIPLAMAKRTRDEFFPEGGGRSRQDRRPRHDRARRRHAQVHGRAAHEGTADRTDPDAVQVAAPSQRPDFDGARDRPPTRCSTSENITKRFVDRDGALVAVDDVSFSVAPGEFVSIIGPSGCGKSTLFNIIGGLTGDYEGRVTVEGDDGRRGPHPAIGMVFQEESTFPWRTVEENVAFPLEIAGVAEGERHGARARISSRSSASPASSAAIRRSFPAACGSASPSRARSLPSRASC